MPTSIHSPTDRLGGRIVIDHAHHHIHNGEHFTACVYEADLDSASTLTILITAPAAKECHIVPVVVSSLGGTVSWSEAPNASGGSAIVSYNNNRLSSNAATAVFTSDPTFVSAGTVFITLPVGAGGTPIQAAGGDSNGSRPEWILNNGVLYLLRYTSLAANNAVLLCLDFYEED